MKSLPFVDLKAQYARLRPRIAERMQAVLEHGRFILGPEVAELEQRLCELVGARHAIGVSSGTDALLIPLLAHGVGPGDAVFVPTFTFTATAEVPLLLGASPVFVDVCEDSYNLDPQRLRELIARTAAAGRLRPRAILGVDLFGLPADWDQLEEIAREHQLLLIDDAAQGVGGAIGERRVGALVEVTATSFFPAKPLGAYGDAGAIFTEDPELARVYRSLRVHGEGENRYEVVRVGINGRLDSLQAAVLLAKLEIFEEELELREKVASYYDRRLEGAVVLPPRIPGRRSAWAQYTIQTELREALRQALQGAGIPTAIHYPLPMHLQSAYRAFGDGEGSCPISERLCERVLSLPLHPYLAESDADRICSVLLEALEPASRGTSGLG